MFQTIWQIVAVVTRWLHFSVFPTDRGRIGSSITLNTLWGTARKRLQSSLKSTIHGDNSSYTHTVYRKAKHAYKYQARIHRGGSHPNLSETRWNFPWTSASPLWYASSLDYTDEWLLTLLTIYCSWLDTLAIIHVDQLYMLNLKTTHGSNKNRYSRTQPVAIFSIPVFFSFLIF